MNEYVAFLEEVFERFGPIQPRRMFGGYGIFFEGLMIGLVSDDTLYLKADAENARHFEERGLRQFEYNKNGKVMKMSYYLAPEEIMDDATQAAEWARRSYEAALRSKTPKKKSK